MTLANDALRGAASKAGAVFGLWHGLDVALSYGAPTKEYRSAREGVALHDASYLGRVKATGVDVLDLINRLSTNKVDDLALGSGAVTILPSEKGRIVDLVQVVNLGPYVLLLTGPGAQGKVTEWIDRYTFVEDAILEEVGPKTAFLTLIGPQALGILEKAVGKKLESLEPLASMVASISGTEVYVIRRDLGGHRAFSLLASAEEVECLWSHLVALGPVPVGMDAWDALRVEEGVPIYGQELTEEFNPLEAGLIGGIDFAKGCYIGQEVIARLDTYDKVQKSLVTLDLTQASGLDRGAALLFEGKRVGSITSIAGVPGGGTLGLGYVRRGVVREGALLSIEGDPGAKIWVTGLPSPLGPAQG